MSAFKTRYQEKPDSTETNPNFDVSFDWDSDYDFAKNFLNQDQSFFGLLSSHLPSFLNLNFLRWFRSNDRIWKQFYVDYRTKAIYFEDVQILERRNFFVTLDVETNKSLVKWNVDFLKSFLSFSHGVDLSDPVVKSAFIQSLYKSPFAESSYWYNLHTNRYSIESIEKLSNLKGRISELKEWMMQLEERLDASTVQMRKLSIMEKLLGQERYFQNEFERKSRELEQRNAMIDERNDARGQVNKLFKALKDQAPVLIDKLIGQIQDDLNSSLLDSYESGKSFVGFVENVLHYSVLNEVYGFAYNVSEVPGESHVVVNFTLPDQRDIPNAKGYKEFKKDARFELIKYAERDFKKIYDNALMSILFRVIKEILGSDYNRSVGRLTLNGWVNALNRSNGQYENKCILSVSIGREQYEQLNMSLIEPREAFKSLKGVSGKTLIDFTPVAPIVNLEKTDKRFIQSVDVLENMSNFTNLATIDWEEFEHLVRELFEKEFAATGGEVKVTQSSRDGGVDAIAFDPDPIRGGKIVIQSKRYTNVVGVSAIRDLFGTVINEGATKGIIVTTSHYGNDAYEFAKGKPLTLLDGNNLLRLLEKHGYNVKIDINEAKKLER